MKKILSLALAVSMLVSAVPMAYAADTQDYTQGTQVSYTAANVESYTITVPAKLAPGDTGTVTAKGTWPSTKNLRVTADESIEMVNSISTASNKELDITFEPIILAGSQTAEVSATSDITVEDITDALFGTWSGIIHYNVDYVVKLGDADGNGRITASEVTNIVYLLQGSDIVLNLAVFDVNQDGVVNSTDAEAMRLMSLRKEDDAKAIAPNIGTYVPVGDTVPTIEYYPNLVGDVDGDGKILPGDAAKIGGLCSKQLTLDDVNLVAADANEDKIINQADADMIFNYYTGSPMDGSIVGQYRQDVDNSEYTIEYTTTE